MCLTASFACLAQSSDGYADSLLQSLSPLLLQEVTVQANPVISRPDGSAYIPGAEKKRTAVGGLDLLQKMQLPRISVNMLTGDVGLSGGGVVKLCINGVEVTSSEISALRSADIVRIEYHDNPGARYSGADAVIDYITCRHDSGGNVSMDGMNALGNGKWAAIDNVSAQYNHGSSSFTANVGYFGLHRDNWLRDYEEIWHYPDADVTRIEKGMPVTIGTSGLDAHFSYTFAREKRYVFNARASFTGNYIPDKEEGDRHTLLYTSASDDVTEIREHTRERDTTPSLSLYCKYYLGGAQSVTANIAGSYTRSGSRHTYSESCDGDVLADIVSDVHGRKYTAFAEAYYENRIGASHIIAGARYQQAFTSNCYSGTTSAVTTLHQADGSVFGEYDVRLADWRLLANLTANRLYVRQENVEYTKCALLPSFGVGYMPGGSLSVRYDVKACEKQPPLAAMSNVEQAVQPGMVRRGNMQLKPYSEIDQRFTMSYIHRFFSADLLVAHRNERKPVMSTTFYDGQQFVMTYDNHRAFQELRGELSLSVRPWAEHLSVSVAPSLSRYFSRGNSYSHVRNIFRVALGVDFSYGNWTFNANTMSGHDNYMYGEEIITEKDMNMILIGYKRNRWSLQSGVFNAFMKDYWMKTENMSSLTPYTSKAHCGKNAYAVMRFSLSLDFGRKSAVETAPGQWVPDNDNGIMDGTR